MERKHVFLIFTSFIFFLTLYVGYKLEFHSKVTQWTKNSLDINCGNVTFLSVACPKTDCPKCPSTPIKVSTSSSPKTQTTISSKSTPCPKIDCPKCPSTPVKVTPVPYLQLHRQISSELAELYLLLNHAVTHKTAPSPKVLLTLKGIIGQLDPAHKLSQEDKEATDPGPTNSSEILDVCPEKYMGEKFGYPFYHKGWINTDCSNVKPLPKVLTIALNTMEYPEPMEKQVDVVLKGINVTYPDVQVLLAPKTSKIEETAKKYKNIKVVNAAKGSSLGKVWNQLINEVSTPYTLIGRDVVHFTWVTRAERQIRMISTTEHVGVVGGSFRNLSGHWRVGCRQTKLFNYVLQYEEGYHYSRKSCMFCDDLEGPFVAKTDLLKAFKFSEKYSKEIIFEELFVRIFSSGNLIMNCPDAMYYTTDYSTEAKRNKKTWLPLATDIKLNRVILPGGIRHAFSCGDISYKCSVGITKYAALPICCLEQFGNAMQFFKDFCDKNHLHFELDAGSVLAAVKFDNYSPFDLDGDLSISSWNISIISKGADVFSKGGFRVTGFKPPTFKKDGKLDYPGYILYYSPDMYTEVWGFPKMSSYDFSPPELNQPSTYTKALINGHWINTMHFPGLFARNRYGLDVYKHSQSWLQVGGMGTSWGRYKPGGFLPCTQPTFHSCLDKFPADGNIAFKVDP